MDDGIFAIEDVNPVERDFDLAGIRLGDLVGSFVALDDLLADALDLEDVGITTCEEDVASASPASILNTNGTPSLPSCDQLVQTNSSDVCDMDTQTAAATFCDAGFQTEPEKTSYDPEWAHARIRPLRDATSGPLPKIMSGRDFYQKCNPQLCSNVVYHA